MIKKIRKERIMDIKIREWKIEDKTELAERMFFISGLVS